MGELGHGQERILKGDPKVECRELNPRISRTLWNITENDTKDSLLMGFKIESINPGGSKLPSQLCGLKG